MIIIRPEQRTLRQDALSGLGTALGSGIENYMNAFQRGEQTKRQQALQDQDTALKLREMGIDATAEEFRNASSSSEPGALTKLFSKRTQEYQDNMARAADDRKFKREGELFDRDLKQQEMALKRMQLGQGKMKDQLELQKLQNEMANKNLELEVPGYGLARTKEEAKDIRTAMADANDAMKIIDEIKSLGTNVAWWDRDKVGRINQLKTVLAGKLRLPLTGPGAMTEDEFQRLVSNIGDPSAIFGTESNEMAKLDQMKEILNNTVQQKFASASRGQFNPKGFSGGTKEMVLGDVNFRGGTPNVPFSPTNVPDISPIQSATAGKVVPVNQHPQAAQAIEWAQKNSNDPRAAEIMRRYGGR